MSETQYMCFIGNEEILESAKDPMEAASNAMEYYLQNKNSVEITAMIKVDSVDNKDDQYYIYVPAILSNIGRHKQSAELISKIERFFAV